MRKAQYIALLFAVLLAAVLHFGFDKKTPAQKEAVLKRELLSEVLNMDNLIQKRKKELDQNELTGINILEGRLQDSSNINILRELSGQWFSLGYPEVAGFYAKTIAEELNTSESWGIAGTTYMYGVRKYEDQTLRTYCRDNAERAFENAISLDTDNISHMVNLAVLRAEVPHPDNPMLGIQMLLDLNRDNPENTTVLMTLARFGMQTGQYEKVKERLLKVLELEPENSSARCMLGRVHEALGNAAEAMPLLEFCK